MRCVLCLLLFLGGLVWCAARIELSSSTMPRERIVDSHWRRTTNGWQRADRWPGAHLMAEPIESLAGFAIPRLSLPHPLIIALLLLLPSLLSLLAFAPAREPRTK